MFCNNCGENNRDDAIFCSKCGARLNEVHIDAKQEADRNKTGKTKNKSALKFLNVLSKICFWGGIAGLLGATMFFVIALVGLIAYGEVFLYGGYSYTKVLTTISIVLMMVGICSITTKAILNLVFKIGKFPTTLVRRILVGVIVVVCLAFSIWGFTDCGKHTSSYNPGTSTGGNYDNTVDASIGLSLSVTSISTSGSYTYVYCSIKNVSHLYGNATMYRNVKVKGVFKDRYRSVVDTDWTYAVDSVWLNSGETKTFKFMIKNTSIKSATLSIM